MLIVAAKQVSDAPDEVGFGFEVFHWDFNIAWRVKKSDKAEPKVIVLQCTLISFYTTF